LILQPLVENAIHHGIASSRGNAWVEISSQRNENVVELQVRNSIGSNRPEGTGLGLRNTKARLTHLYSGEATLSFMVSEDKTAIAAIPADMRTWWRYHQVEYGESLGSISRKYHTSTSSIAEANNLSSEEVKVGSKLIIPIAPGKQTGETVAYSSHATHYKVRKGDTVGSVADDFEVPADKVRKWNHLHGTALAPGRMLVIYKPTNTGGPEVASSRHTSAASKGKVSPKTTSSSKATTTASAAKYHKVKKGETLSSIAESYNTSVAALKRDNPKLAASLRAGDVVVIHK